MKTNSKIFNESVAIMNGETFKQGLRRAVKASGSLSQVIKVATRDLWEELNFIMPSIGVDCEEDLTPAKVLEAAKVAGLTKTDKAGNVNICKVYKCVEKETVSVKDEAGNVYTMKRPKLDKAGHQVVKYELKKIGAWTLVSLVEVLTQASVASEK